MATKGPVLPRALIVNGLGDQIFASAAFALNENGGSPRWQLLFARKLISSIDLGETATTS